VLVYQQKTAMHSLVELLAGVGTTFDSLSTPILPCFQFKPPNYDTNPWDQLAKQQRQQRDALVVQVLR
jgi:hypothetical protein